MKKSILLILCVCLLLLSLTACGFGGSDGVGDNGGTSGGNNDTTGEESAPTQDGSIFSNAVDTRIVVATGETADVFGIMDEIYSLTGRNPELVNDKTEKAPHEIVIGNTSRAVTDKALTLMERAIEDTPMSTEDYGFLIYFSIYSDGESVALVWSDESFKADALKYFLEKYVVSEKLELQKGYSDVYCFSRLAEMRENEEAQREEIYERITAQYGEGVADAIRDQYSLYDERFYLWLADLYDPGEYDEDGNPKGGGFYYSNSARDTVGYLIDIESTSQALGFLVSSGMMRGYGNDYMKAIPEKMQKEMVAFALSLQSSVDGYFYHPQWGTNISAGRLSRDMGNAVSVLSKFGYKPYYNTPGGAEGSQGNPPGVSAASLTERLAGKSTVTAVSKVIQTASSIWPDRLKTLENWKAYIDAFEDKMDTKSYSIGHDVAEQSSQIKNREAEAKKNGEPTGYIEYVQKFFDRHQNPENGLWEDEVSYNSVNGLMKIMAIYNWLDLPLNYAEKAYASAVEIIKLEGEDVNGKEASNSVDVYNAWCCLTRINENINNFGSKETVAALRANLLLDAEEMIRITTKKTAKFVKNDGSYGYSWDYSPAKSQGAPAAVPNTVEGDVNGGTISLTAITGNMMSALGISGLYIYYPSDFEVFIKRVAEHSAVEKNEVEVFPVEVNFDDEEDGETEPSDIGKTLTDGFIETAYTEDRGGNRNMALRLTTVKDKGDAFNITPLQIKVGELNRYILEWDMKFESISANNSPAMQVKLGNMYMLTFKLTKDGVLSFGDSSTTNSSPITTVFNGSFDALAWHRVRIEHYPEEGTPVTRIYVDGTLIGESSNYLGKQSGAPSEPAYTIANFYALFSTDFVGYFDNIVLNADAKRYDGSFNEELPEEYTADFDFDEAELGEPNLEGLTTTPNPEDGNSIVIRRENETSENNVLCLTAKTSSKAGNWVKVEAPKGDGTTYVYEMDVCAETLNRAGDIAQIFFRNTKGGTIFALNMKFVKSGNGHKLTFMEKISGGTSTPIFFSVDEVLSGWFSLRIEYDTVTCTATVTVNDTHVGTTGAYYSEVNKSGDLGGVDFYTTFATDAVLLLDNISLKHN